MNIPNPAQVASARTARLVREARTPVYTTETRPKVRQHLKMVELEHEYGGRFWSKPMPESEVSAYIDEASPSYSVSDVDCWSKCWCVK